jgi:hypothetical protein
MMANPGLEWQETNQRYLMAALEVVRLDLERYVQSTPEEAASEKRPGLLQQASQLAASMSPPPVLDTMCSLLDLSPFERDLLLLCAGVELDGGFAQLCARVQGDSLQAHPTFSLALAALNNSHWSALTPNAPLRRWKLIEVGPESGLRLSPLRIDEQVLHALAGVQQTDHRLLGIIYPVEPVESLVPSHCELAQRIAAIWSQPSNVGVRPVVQLFGEEVGVKRDVMAAACGIVGLELNVLPVYAVPTGPSEVENLTRLLEREAILSNSALLLDCDDLDSTDKVRANVVARLIEDMQGVLIMSSREKRRLTPRHPVLTFQIQKPASLEQLELWRDSLGPVSKNMNGHVEALVSQFNLSAPSIRAASAGVLGRLAQRDDEPSSEEIGAMLWDTCRFQAQPGMDNLAQRIEPAAGWEELILPEPQLEVLRDVASQVRQRFKVYETWGFGSKSKRGLGISALFAGVSGTGKTMAAEVLANELRLDLYRIDLSAVVSKYIGETEKNLRQVFDSAEEGGAILLFDEADALFGQRSEVQDSHDRYANIEVSYLLQRMEAYRGLAILTTNMKEDLDSAFLRRIRFIVQFPFPDPAQRLEIWRRVFPADTPTRGLDLSLLAQLNLAGGTIRNIALNAAFLAADANEPVQMKHLLRSARSEYIKLDQPLTQGEVWGWP